jgi:hypothetical protein
MAMSTVNDGLNGRLDRGRFAAGNARGRVHPCNSAAGTRALTEALRRYLDGNIIGGKLLPRGLTVAEARVEAIFIHAIKGDFRFAKAILEPGSPRYDML